MNIKTALSTIYIMLLCASCTINEPFVNTLSEENPPMLVSLQMDNFNDNDTVTIHYSSKGEHIAKTVTIMNGSMETELPADASRLTAVLTYGSIEPKVDIREGIMSITAKASAEPATAYAATTIIGENTITKTDTLFKTVEMTVKNDLPEHYLIITAVGLYGTTSRTTYPEIPETSSTSKGYIEKELNEPLTLHHGEQTNILSISMPAELTTGTINIETVVLTATIKRENSEVPIIENTQIWRKTNETNLIDIPIEVDGSTDWKMRTGETVFDDVWFKPSIDNWNDINI